MSKERIYNVLLGAHISEKTTVVADTANQFVFKVAKDASRPEIKQAVEQIYGVNVESVSVANVKGKVKRTVRGLSKRASWKIDFTAEAK
jgi:large subunit ribosomal protein L23